MTTRVINEITHKYEENKQWVEYSIILMVEASFAVLLMQYMFNTLVNIIS